MQHVKTKSVGVYHPDNQPSNDFYIEHFKRKGRDITSFLKVMGRDKRYIIDNEHETSITMAIEASKRALETAGLTGEDIDLIIFTTQVPEVTLPTCAVELHYGIQGKKSCITYDMNANCAGMTIAVEQASRVMTANPRIKYALVVGSERLSAISNPNEEITYASFSDSAGAVILEQSEEQGFIDAMYETDSSFKDNIRYPKEGLTHVQLNNVPNGRISWKPFDGAVSIPFACAKIEELLQANNVSIDDVKACCFSQFALSNILRIQNHFNLPDEKMVVVGDRYGYTGTSSPFIALYEGIQDGRIKRGDLVLFWTIGTGHEFIAMLYRY